MLISHINKPHIFITMGDPSGIGPEVVTRSMASPEMDGLAVFIILGDAGVIAKASKGVLDEEYPVYRPGGGGKIELGPHAVNVVDPGPELENAEPGRPDNEGSKKALECLEGAVRLMRDIPAGVPRALVTAPLSKERVASVHPGFVGHTEYLQEAFSSDMVTMVMIGEHLRVVPVTRHIPLREVAAVLTKDLVLRTLEQVAENSSLISGKDDAKIGVSALNPHCGEGGKIGTEEIDIISPAVEEAKKRSPGIIGPVSADVVFTRAMKQEIDIVVAMYHDQGLGPFKMVDFDNGVNMTLGLDYVRTSPDHGTAFDIAGKGIASPHSMQRAIKLAVNACTGVNV